jgi:hypothetical protein
MLRFEWLGLAALVTLTVWSSEPAPASSEPDDTLVYCTHRRMTAEQRQALELQLAMSRVRTMRTADRHYRDGDSARAAQTIRDTGMMSLDNPLMLDPELQSLAELYTAFAEASATIAAPETSTVDRFVALRRAQALDMSLGGAFADRLNARMREVATQAAAAYEHAGDRLGADLAKHTAELFK